MNTTAPTTPGHIECPTFCTVDHAHGFTCLSEDRHVELSQHVHIGRGVSRDEASLSLRQDHAAGLALLDLETPHGVTNLTILEARELYAALGQLLAIHDGAGLE